MADLLTKLSSKYGCDKSDRRHRYTPLYHKYFSYMREQDFYMLEFGFGQGKSVKMWLEYFPNATLSIPKSYPGLIYMLTIGLAFVIANFTYQLGLMFYNSFLPTLVPKNIQGKVSGLGIALGYAGVLAAFFPAKYIFHLNPLLVFPFGGLMFFLFSLPMFITVPERKPLIEEPITKDVIKKEIFTFIYQNYK